MTTPSSKPPPSLPKVYARFQGTTDELLGVTTDFGPAFFRCLGNVSFGVHCEPILRLLKRSRLGESKEERRRNARALFTWVFMACYPKIRRRLYTGIHGRNIWKFVMEISEDDMRNENAQYEDLKMKYLSNDIATPKQARFLRKHFSADQMQQWDQSLPLFNKNGRKMLWRLMQQLLVRVRESLDVLRLLMTSEETRASASLAESDPAFVKAKEG